MLVSSWLTGLVMWLGETTEKVCYSTRKMSCLIGDQFLIYHLLLLHFFLTLLFCLDLFLLLFLLLTCLLFTRFLKVGMMSNKNDSVLICLLFFSIFSWLSLFSLKSFNPWVLLSFNRKVSLGKSPTKSAKMWWKLDHQFENSGHPRSDYVMEAKYDKFNFIRW